jgi:hypothetical protein
LGASDLTLLVWTVIEVDALAGRCIDEDLLARRVDSRSGRLEEGGFAAF